MLSNLLFVFALLAVTVVDAVPLNGAADASRRQSGNARSRIPSLPDIHRLPIDPLALLCDLIPWLCPKSTKALGTSVSTPIGTAQGIADGSANRFVVKYASASRWQLAQMATSWSLPNGLTNPGSVPLACPQDNSTENSTPTSEDCLSLILYVPTTLAANSNAPVFVWFHGGSNVVGSATGPGLDGANLASATGAVVAVIQYRLGALGFLPPTPSSPSVSSVANLALKDVITSLNFIRSVVPSFGGSTSKITLAGQSSGATLIRALLATPSASGLFSQAILQSDVMDNGFLDLGSQATLASAFFNQVGCAQTNTTCLNSLSLDDILDGSDYISGNGGSIAPKAGTSMPMRTVLDGTLVTNPLDSTAAFPAQNKHIIITNVATEAGSAIFSDNAFGTFTVGSGLYQEAVEGTFGDPRTGVLLNSSLYGLPAGVGGDTDDPSDFDARPALQLLGTDSLWRCPTWSFARAWAAAGGTVYAGIWGLGNTYPSNAQNSFCTSAVTPTSRPGSAAAASNAIQTAIANKALFNNSVSMSATQTLTGAVAGPVCHEDDILMVFGHLNSPSTAEAALSNEVQARYKSFLSGGSPNANGAATWGVVPSGNPSDINALILGGSGAIAPVVACDTTFWGSQVQFDYQVFGL